MFKTNVSMSARTAGEGVGVIDIDGEVNHFAEDILMDAFDHATGQGAHTVILNFTKMKYMNSSGVGLLVTLLIRAQRQGQRLLVYGLNEHYRQIFELTRLNEAISIYPDEAQALAAAVTPSVSN